MIACFYRIYALFLFLASFSVAFQVTESTGRVDLRDRNPNGFGWIPIQKQNYPDPQLQIRLEKNASIRVEVQPEVHLYLQGPSTGRLQLLPAEYGNGYDFHLDEFHGWVWLESKASSRFKISCGEWVITGDSAQVGVQCDAIEKNPLVQVAKGQVQATKRNGHSIALENGKSWAIQGGQERFLQGAPSLVLPKGLIMADSTVYWKLEKGAKKINSTEWDVGSYLHSYAEPITNQAPLDHKKGIQFQLQVDSAEVRVLEQEWSLALKIQVRILHQDQKYSDRIVYFRYGKSVINQQPNSFAFLARLPLTRNNEKVLKSLWSDVAVQWQKWVQTQLLDPFAREGMIP